MNTQETNNTTLTDIVFANRNKDYGAFLLRKKYLRNVFIALAICSVSFAAFFIINLLQVLNNPPVVVAEPEQVDTIAIVDVAIEPTEVKPDLAVVVEPPNIEKVKYTAYVEVPDKEAVEPIKSNEELDNKNLSETDQKGKDTIVADGGGDDLAKKVDDVGKGTPEPDEIWMGAVTKKANPGGGFGEFQKFIMSRLSDRTRNYMSERGVKGTIHIKALVNKDGKISEISLARGLTDCEPCNEEFPKLVGQYPKDWEPAENNGHKVKLWVYIPLKIE